MLALPADARVADEHATYAVEGARNVASIKVHVGHVLHAIDPKQEADGPGTGYGLTRALEGSAQHLGYAREVPDASANLKNGLPAVIGQLDALRRESQMLAVLARDARQSPDDAHVVTYAQELSRRCSRLAAGLEQTYLFGVIRLPSGDWAFDPDLHKHPPGSPSTYKY